MHKKNRMAFLSLSQITLDALSIILAFFLSYIIASDFTGLRPIENYSWLLLAFLPLWILTMYVFRMYYETTFMYLDRIIKSVVKSTFFSALILAAMMYSVKENMLSRMLFGIFLFISSVLVTVVRLIYAENLKKKKIGSHGPNVLVIGSADLYNRFNYYVKKTSINLNIIGFMKMNDECYINEKASLVEDTELKAFVHNHVIDEVVFALPRDNVCKLERYVRYFEEMGITVRMLLDLFDLKVAKIHVSAVGTIPMITFHSVTLDETQLWTKRMIDIMGASIGLIFTFILGIFIALAIKLESKGPVIFSQKRVGVRGRVFKCYKFRSMYNDAEERRKELERQNQVEGGYMFKIKDDPRITKVGKFLRKTSLDELPQFFNVLRGDMSLVGTRPPTLDEVEKYQNSHKRRISIKPGITGMWQIMGRSSIKDFDEVVKLDTEYIDNWSLWLDLKILFKTIFVVFQRKGAF